MILEAHPGRHWAFQLPQHDCGLACISHGRIHGRVCWWCPLRLALGILLYWGCPLEVLWEHKGGQQRISLAGEMEVRCLNWQKCLVYIRRCGVRQMRKCISPCNIRLKCLAPGRLKSSPCAQPGLNASRCETHDVAPMVEGRFGSCASSCPAN